MKDILVGVVGPCGAGKSTLVTALKSRGIQAKHIAQEHSYVPAMWQKMTNPDVLIYLEVSHPVTIQRRQLDWLPREYEEQLTRLQHAKQHADLTIETDNLTPQQVLDKVLSYLEQNPQKNLRAEMDNYQE
jgi:deoxyadenosine/deoxycytidine kinase